MVFQLGSNPIVFHFEFHEIKFRGKACTEARMAEVAAAEELARMEADAAKYGYGGD